MSTEAGAIQYDAVKCFKVNEEYEADLLVFEVKEEYQAIGDDAKWCYVNDEYRASTKVHWVDQEYSADLKIYLVKEEYQAGWRKKEHKLRYKL